VADYIRERSEIEVILDPKGKIGELTVWVEDKLVVTKGLFKFPDKQSVLDAVQKEMELR
jgi:hypothetical protein